MNVLFEAIHDINIYRFWVISTSPIAIDSPHHLHKPICMVSVIHHPYPRH
jgi:hypothetical protein